MTSQGSRIPQPGDTRAEVEAMLGVAIETDLLSSCTERLRYEALDVTLMNGVVESVTIRGEK